MRLLADFWVQVWQALLVSAAAFAIADGWIPPEHLPWKPLDLDRPIGAATPAKIRALDIGQSEDDQQAEFETQACMDLLRRSGVEVERAEDLDDGGFCVARGLVRITGGDVTPIVPAGQVMRCPLAVRYVLWDRQVLRPAARDILGSAPARTDVSGIYACRRIYGSQNDGDRPSEHARANALDVFGVTLEDGRRVSVLEDWGPVEPGSRRARLDAEAAVEAGRSPPELEPYRAPTEAETLFLRRIRDEACPIFGTVLSPEYNAAHADHLHLDGSTFGLCG